MKGDIIKELVDDKVIGDVRFVNVTLYQEAAKEDYERENLPWRLITEIVGDRGKVYFEFFSDNPIYIKDQSGIKEYKYTNPEHVSQPFIQTVVNELIGIGKCAGDLKSSVLVTKFADEVLREYREEKGLNK